MKFSCIFGKQMIQKSRETFYCVCVVRKVGKVQLSLFCHEGVLIKMMSKDMFMKFRFKIILFINT